MGIEPAGLALVVENASSFLSTLDRAEGAVTDFGATTDRVAGQVDSLGGASKGAGGLLSGLGSVAGGAAAAGLGVLAGAAAGVVAGIAAAAERAAAFRQTLGQDFPTDQIAAMNDEVALLERRFGAELPAQLDAARQLVANGLAPDFDAAMDIITAGFTEGLNVGDDFLDTLREYSGNFASLGFAGDDVLTMINRGLEAGARNSDVLADAVKEFGILIREPGTVEAVSALDGEVGSLVQSFQEGKITGEEAFNLIGESINGIEDPIKRNQVGIALFGTLWEDVGEKAILSMSQANDGLINSAGAADQAASKITSFGEILPMIGDKLGTAFLPLADTLLAFVNEHWPAVESAIDTGIGWATDFAAALGGSADAAARLPEPLQAIIGGIENVKGAIDGFAASEFGQDLRAGAEAVASYFQNDFGPAIQGGIDNVKGALDAFGDTPFGQRLQAGAQVAANYFANDFYPDIKAGAGEVVKALESIADSPWGQEVQQGAQVAFDYLSQKGGEVASYFANDWPGDFENGVAVVTGALDTLASSPWAQDFQQGAQVVATYFANDFAADFQGGVDLVVGALSNLPGEAERIFGQIVDAISGLPETMAREGAAIGSAVASGIQSGFSNAWGQVKAWIAARVAEIPAPVRQALGIGSPSRVMAEEIGLPLAQGVALGFTTGLPTITAALGQLGPTLTDTWATQLDGAFGAVAPGVEAQASTLGAVFADGLSAGVLTVGKQAEGWGKAIESALGTATEGTSGIGRDAAAGLAEGLQSGLTQVQSAAQQVASSVTSAMQGALQISSPSRAMAEQVGAPIVQGIAQGILGNMDRLLAVAGTLTHNILTEARAFAQTIQQAVGPLLANSLKGAADFARAQLRGMDVLEGLRVGTTFPEILKPEAVRAVQASQDEFDALSRESQRLMDEIDKLEAQANEPARTGGSGGSGSGGSGRGGTSAAEREAERRRELEEEIAQLRYTAANNIDPAKRAQAAERLVEAERKLAEFVAETGEGSEAAAAAASEEEERRARIAALWTQQRYIAEETARAEERYQAEQARLDAERAAEQKRRDDEYQKALAEQNRQKAIAAKQNQIADKAERDILAARQQALRITDPAERAAFLDMRIRQIEERAKLEQQIAAEQDAAEKRRLEARRKLIIEAQKAEGALYIQEAQQRAQQQQAALQNAQNAVLQLTNLVHFSHIDLRGIGNNMIRGIGQGMLQQLAGLSGTLNGAMAGVLRSLRQALGIQSPSQLFADAIGGPLAAGIGVGFERQIDRIRPAVNAQVQALVSPVRAPSTAVMNVTNSVSISAPGATSATVAGLQGVAGQINATLGARTRRADTLTRMR